MTSQNGFWFQMYDEFEHLYIMAKKYGVKWKNSKLDFEVKITSMNSVISL